MTFFKWDASLGTGLDEIDDQHKQLFGLMTQLHEAMRQGKGKDIVADALASMTAYTDYHFGKEEDYMREFKYPDYPAHKKEHTLFVAKINEFKANMETGKKLTLSMDLMNFLRDWLMNHIKIIDKKYAPLFREHGVS